MTFSPLFPWQLVDWHWLAYESGAWTDYAKSVSMPKQSCCGIQFPALVKPWVIYSVNHVYLTFDWYAEITFRKKWILEISTLFPNFKHSREDFRSQVPTCDGMYKSLCTSTKLHMHIPSRILFTNAYSWSRHATRQWLSFLCLGFFCFF